MSWLCVVMLPWQMCASLLRLVPVRCHSRFRHGLKSPQGGELPRVRCPARMELCLVLAVPPQNLLCCAAIESCKKRGVGLRVTLDEVSHKVREVFVVCGTCSTVMLSR